MANEEHVAMLKENIVAWNKNLRKFKAVDLSRADLRGADLRGIDVHFACFVDANLSGANLSGATFIAVDLSGADLSDANLSGTVLTGPNGSNLSRANLSGANLSGADLNGMYYSGSDLSGANLCNANLSGAFLCETDLKGANLSGANLSGADLSEADLSGANLSGANLSGTDLRIDLARVELIGGNLSRADLRGVDLSGKNLKEVKLSQADLRRSNLSGADLRGADLRGTDLRYARLIEANLSNAVLDGCKIYGASVWNVQIDMTSQKNLAITNDDEPLITVDNIEVAQFIHLLLRNDKIRHIIDTITTKVVVILGRFTDERKVVLDALREELRDNDYLPILFDFDKPSNRNTTETIQTLAHMARFIIADITEPRSVPQELYAVIPHLPSVPVQPLLQSGATEYAMFRDFRDYPWVLEPVRYKDTEHAIALLRTTIMALAEQKAAKLIT